MFLPMMSISDAPSFLQLLCPLDNFPKNFYIQRNILKPEKRTEYSLLEHLPNRHNGLCSIPDMINKRRKNHLERLWCSSFCRMNMFCKVILFCAQCNSYHSFRVSSIYASYWAFPASLIYDFSYFLQGMISTQPIIHLPLPMSLKPEGC